MATMIRPAVLAPSLLLLAACGASGSAGTGGGGGSCPETPFASIPTPSPLFIGTENNLIAFDDTDIFEVTVSFQILSAPKGGGPELLVTQGDTYESLSATGPSLFATVIGDAVLRIAKDGSSRTQIAGGQVGCSLPGQQAVAADDAHVYWVGEGPAPGEINTAPTMGFLRRSDPDGSNVVELATGLQAPTSVLVGGGSVTWAEQGSFGFASSPMKDGTVRTVPTGGGPVVTLASGLVGPVVRARRDGFVWFSGGLDLYRVPEGGGDAQLMIRSAAQAAVGATAVFWLENAGQHTLLLRTPIAGGCSEPIALMDGATAAPVVADPDVYVMTPGGVVRVGQ